MHALTADARPSRRKTLLALAAGAGLLAGCGDDGTNRRGNARVRAINLASDLPVVDLFFNDERRFAALAAETLADEQSLNDQAWTIRLTSAGETTTLLSQAVTLGREQHYTLVVWGRQTAPRLSTLDEDQNDGAITAASGRLRVLNATLDSVALDVFVTAAGVDLGGAVAHAANIASGQLSAFRDLPSGTFRLRVTGAGDPDNVRLDIADYVVADKTHATLVLTSGPSGVLVNGRTIRQRAGSSAQKTTQARVRVAAGADSAAAVAVAIGSRTITPGLRSPVVGPYQNVDAGSREAVVRINGAVVSNAVFALVAGQDYTLLVYGNGLLRWIEDDNRLPAGSTRARIRLVHGAAGAPALSLSVDLAAVVNDVALGSAAPVPPAALNAISSARIDVTAAAAAAPLFSASEVNLQAQSVYTVFVLGGNPAPTGLIRKDR